MSGSALYAAKGYIQKQEKQIATLQGAIESYLKSIEKYRKALLQIADAYVVEGCIDSEYRDVARVALGLPLEGEEPHSHTCRYRQR